MIQTNDAQAVTYAMIRKRFDKAKATAKKEFEKLGDVWIDYQRRDLRAKSAQDSESVEEAKNV